MLVPAEEGHYSEINEDDLFVRAVRDIVYPKETNSALERWRRSGEPILTPKSVTVFLWDVPSHGIFQYAVLSERCSMELVRV